MNIQLILVLLILGTSILESITGILKGKKFAVIITILSIGYCVLAFYSYKSLKDDTKERRNLVSKAAEIDSTIDNLDSILQKDISDLSNNLMDVKSLNLRINKLGALTNAILTKREKDLNDYNNLGKLLKENYQIEFDMLKSKIKTDFISSKQSKKEVDSLNRMISKLTEKNAMQSAEINFYATKVVLSNLDSLDLSIKKYKASSDILFKNLSETSKRFQDKYKNMKMDTANISSDELLKRLKLMFLEMDLEDEYQKKNGD